MLADPALAPLVDRYLAVARDLRRLEAARDDLKDALVAALGDQRGTFPGRGGTVRVVERPTCRFEAPRVLAALDEARWLREVALVPPARLLRAMEANVAVARAVAPHVERASYTFVDWAPGR